MVSARDFVMITGVVEKYGKTYIVAKGCEHES